MEPSQVQPQVSKLHDDDLIPVSLEGRAQVELPASQLAALLRDGKSVGSVCAELENGQVVRASFAVLRTYVFGPEHSSQPAPKR